MATSAAVLSFANEYGTSFKFCACLRLHYCVFVRHKRFGWTGLKIERF